jgi:predicted  nucleic acid-binding Zn-ribbon protein
MPHYMTGSLEDRLKTDPEYRKAESLVRELEREFDIAKQEVQDLERRITGLEASRADEEEVVLPAQAKLDRARRSLSELYERLQSAWAARDELLKPDPVSDGSKP